MKARFKKNFIVLWCLLIISAALYNSSLGTVAGLHAEENGNRKPEARRAKTLSPSSFKPITDAQTAIELGNYDEALGILNNFLEGNRRIKDFDRATAYQLMGYIHINNEDYENAAAEFERALALEVLEEERNTELCYSLVRLYFSLDEYEKSLDKLKLWFDLVDEPASQALFLAAQLYATVGNFDRALIYAEQAMERYRQETPWEPQENRFRLLLSIYMQTGRYDDALPLLEEMIGYWPSDPQYFQNLAVVYFEQGLEKKSFTILALAYENGLLTGSSDIKRLTQLYRYYGYPYKAAEIIEQEMASSRLDSNLENLKELSNAWLQSREWQDAAQSLGRAAVLADDGKLWLLLCKTSIQDEQWEESENYCQNAIDKGGLEEDEGRALQLLALARYEKGSREKALSTFRRCSHFKSTQSECTHWATVILKQKEKESEDARQMKLAELESERRKQRQNAEIQRILQNK